MTRARPNTAAGWAARMGSDQRTRDDEAALEAWLGEDPARADAFADHAALWQAAGALADDPDARAILRGEPARPDRRAAIGLFAAAAAAAVGAVVVGPQVAEWGGLYRTRRGETRRITLADGSALTLDTASRVRIDFSEAERRLTLEKGQAHFQVAKDAARPFRVFVGADEVRAIGTAFGVRKDGARAKVTLEEGVVAVYRDASRAQPAAGLTPPTGSPAPKPAVILKPGQQAVLAPAEPVQVATVDVRRDQAWRFGRLVLDSSPLGEAAAEINRYGGRRIVLADPTLAGLKVSGVFHTRQPEAFVEAMTAAFDLAVVHEDGRELVLGRASAPGG